MRNLSTSCICSSPRSALATAAWETQSRTSSISVWAIRMEVHVPAWYCHKAREIKELETWRNLFVGKQSPMLRDLCLMWVQGKVGAGVSHIQGKCYLMWFSCLSVLGLYHEQDSVLESKDTVISGPNNSSVKNKMQFLCFPYMNSFLS